MDAQEALSRFEQDIRLLKIEFDRFFNGVLDLPPDDFRDDVERRLRELRAERLSNYADTYRLNSLEARYNSLNGLWNRRLRQRERAERAPTPGKAKKGPDPYAGIVIGKRASKKVERALYEELYKSTGRRAKTDFDSFRQFLKTQTQQIRKKTGCSEVRFRIASQGGKLTLKAQPVVKGAG